DNCGIADKTIDLSDFTCASVGDHTVTLTVTDESGNTASGTATVTVVDRIAPVLTCQNYTVTLDASGNATVSVDDLIESVSDACGVSTKVASQTSFTTAHIGANEVTVTVTDIHGNESICTATVTVVDNSDKTAPEAICQDITVELDADGNVSVTADQIDNGSYDSEGEVTLSIDKTTFDCSHIGTTQVVTLTVTDEAGNTSTCTANVMIEDVTVPTVITQDITVELDAGGNVNITADQIDNGSNDNCGIADKTIDLSDFTCASVGDHTVTLTVTDESGNTASGTATVTVVDNIAPTIVCQPVTITLDENGNGVIDITQVLASSEDNCEVDQQSVSQTTFTNSDLGENTVTITVTDIHGNTSTCEAIVTVIEDKEVEVEEDGEVNIEVEDEIVEIEDPENGTVTVEEDGSITYTPDEDFVGEDDFTYTTRDSEGNTTTVTVVVKVLPKNEPPVVEDAEVTISENSPVGLEVHTMVAKDENSAGEDATDELTYEIIDGDPDAIFTIDPITGVITVADNLYLDYERTPVHELLVEVLDLEGERATAVVIVNVENVADVPVTPKKGVSPNNDGVNDTWFIEGIDDYPDNIVKVYNRWGSLVFETKGYKNEGGNAWDGIAKSGLMTSRTGVPDGTYFYFIDLNGDGKNIKTGYIVIKR
ncbi:gliding motility-associated C-terminal domain-containing protein, partial [Algivirga pacifica]|uniref:T9SS type B sorting domain-containing protein n=1 Tax=Algivirga pacifica TaxID=1162670 RepID=UPI0031EB8AA5